MATIVSNIAPIHSSNFAELQGVFASLSRPYGLNEIRRFNQVCKRIYGDLNSIERRRAEEFVDSLIEGVERRELAPKIFGVV